MERLDIYDEHGNRTGRTAIRGQTLTQAERCLAVHVWVSNGKGEYLIQKRSEDREFCPGMWAATSGMVQAGEESLAAAVREAGEELGVTLDANELRFTGRFPWMEWFADVYLVNHDATLEEITVQKEEVSCVRWASMDDILALAQDGVFVNYTYMKQVEW